MKKKLSTIFFFIIGCSNIQNEVPNPTVIVPSIIPEISFSYDSIKATVITDTDLTNFETLSLLANRPISIEHLVNLAYPNLHDSTIKSFKPLVNKSLALQQRTRFVNNIANKDGAIITSYAVDTTWVFKNIREVVNNYNSSLSINTLFDRGGKIPDFVKLVPSTKLLLPVVTLKVPTRASRLPNAPRAYRSGIHRGIDFFSNWGTPIRAVADGVIIRSDLNYEEVPADFRVKMLNNASKLKRTPSDIFNELLLGQAVIIDHGFDLFIGFRAITIYAHLSSIDSNIIPGYKIKRGDVFGRSGNTGTRPSTLGTRDESHLHWELILQDNKGEYYFSDSHDNKTNAYSIENLSFGRNFNNVSLSIWVNNMFDKRYPVRGFYFGLLPPNYEDQLWISYGDPFQAGVSIEYSY